MSAVIFHHKTRVDKFRAWGFSLDIRSKRRWIDGAFILTMMMICLYIVASPLTIDLMEHQAKHPNSTALGIYSERWVIKLLRFNKQSEFIMIIGMPLFPVRHLIIRQTASEINTVEFNLSSTLSSI